MICRALVFAVIAAVLGVSSPGHASSSHLAEELPAAFSDPRFSPFAYREHIESVAPLRRVDTTGKTTTTRLAGAVVKFRALPGLTAEWLQRLINEHRAMMASMPDSGQAMAFCPLALSGVSAWVSPARDGFVVNLQTNDKDTAREVLRRARALVER